MYALNLKHSSENDEILGGADPVHKGAGHVSEVNSVDRRARFRILRVSILRRVSSVGRAAD